MRTFICEPVTVVREAAAKPDALEIIDGNGHLTCRVPCEMTAVLIAARESGETLSAVKVLIDYVRHNGVGSINITQAHGIIQRL